MSIMKAFGNMGFGMKAVGLIGLAVLLSIGVANGFAKSPGVTKSNSGTIVIVFKDGHRQSFNLADIDKVEFPAAEVIGSSSPVVSGGQPSRFHYLGKWEVGDGGGNNFYITLRDDGSAARSLGDERGKWVYMDGQALVTWNDGAQDAIRKVGSKYMKFAYGSGKSFTDTPDNVAPARNTTPRPI
jgi:hypothetical protein